MSSIVQRLIEQATTEVEASGCLWRLQRVDSADMAAMGIAQLVLLPSPAEDAPMDKDAIMRRMSPEQAAKLTHHQDSILCAAILAASADGGETWEDLRFVPVRKNEAPDATPPRVHISRLPTSARSVLFGACMSLVTEEGAAIDRLAAFREEPGHAADG